MLQRCSDLNFILTIIVMLKRTLTVFLLNSILKEKKGKENALNLLDKVAYARLDNEYIVALETLRTYK